MRVTSQTLLKVASETVKDIVEKEHTVLAAFLHGSLNGAEDPAIGGAADIDLVFLHQVRPEVTRRFHRLNDEIHLDIAHLDRDTFRVPRKLRTHPWYGPTIYDYKILFDPSHFLDFAQASVRDRFFSPGNVLERANAFLDQSRKNWSALMMEANLPWAEAVETFLEAIGSGINAFATLYGGPLPERRMLYEFFILAEQAGQAELYRFMVELLGGAAISQDDLNSWLPAWQLAFQAASENAPPRTGIHPERVRYYQGAFETQLVSARPSDAFWLLLYSWTQSIAWVHGQPSLTADWERAFEKLGLHGGDLESRLADLDRFLDAVEEHMDSWGTAQGVGAFE